MSYAVCERFPSSETKTGETFRNNQKFFSVKFQPPTSTICVGSAWGSGLWYPDFGGFEGAPDQNRWRTPHESWFERNISNRIEFKKHQKDQDYEKKVLAKPMKEMLGLKVPIQSKLDIYRPLDPFLKQRERRAIELGETAELREEYLTRTAKHRDAQRWKKSWTTLNRRVGGGTTNSTTSLKQLNNTQIIFQGESISRADALSRTHSGTF